MDGASGAKSMLVVDDHALLRKGVRSVLEEHSDLHVKPAMA